MQNGGAGVLGSGRAGGIPVGHPTFLSSRMLTVLLYSLEAAVGGGGGGGGDGGAEGPGLRAPQLWLRLEEVAVCAVSNCAAERRRSPEYSDVLGLAGAQRPDQL